MDEIIQKPQRIAKVMAQMGLCSRRDAERWILDGRVTVNKKKLDSPAFTVTDADKISVDGKLIRRDTDKKSRLFAYHKPVGLVTTHRDEKGRKTVFDDLPADLPRLISVGRLDLNSEGLLLLTNDGGLSRKLELPETGLKRTYRVRAYGRLPDSAVEDMAKGITIDGVTYAPITAHIDSAKGGNIWVTMTLSEGKNREIRKVLAHYGLQVNRLIRIEYGPYKLSQLKPGAVKEIPIK